MDRTKKILFISVAVLLVAVVAWLLYVVFIAKIRNAGTPTPTVATVPGASSPQGAAAPPSVTTTIPTSYDEQQVAQTIARIAVERFGTYSNQAPGRNVEEVMPLLSAQGKKWMELYRNRPTFTEYQGVTTKVTSAKFKEFIPGKHAVAMVTAHRITTNADGSEKSASQQAEVVLTESGDNNWLVDSITWQ